MERLGCDKRGKHRIRKVKMQIRIGLRIIGGTISTLESDGNRMEIGWNRGAPILTTCLRMQLHMLGKTIGETISCGAMGHDKCDMTKATSICGTI